MSNNWKCVVRYDGTDFSGWQVQPTHRTVQGTIQDALGQIAGAPVKIAGAGRTDSGVHALGQVFTFQWPGAGGPDVSSLPRALSNMVAPDVRIESIEAVPDDFHASFSSTGKRYTYVMSDAWVPDPLLRRYAWTHHWDVDREVFTRMAERFVGYHDFAGFCCSKSGAVTTDRTIHSIEIRDGGVITPVDAEGLWHIEFHGNGFLYKMVRNIVGTLADVARGRITESALEERLNAPAPYQGFTAPAHGLFMTKVEY